MKTNIILKRFVQLSTNDITTDETNHPLSALVSAASYDSSFAPIDGTSASDVYTDLVANGLPTTFTSTIAATNQTSGFVIVGPSGIIPFTVSRVFHRLLHGMTFGTYDAEGDKFTNGQFQFGDSPAWRAPLTYDGSRTIANANQYAVLGELSSAGSVYTTLSETIIPLEDQSFVGSDANFFTVPGVSANSRSIQWPYNPEDSLTGNLAKAQTFIETLNPQWLGANSAGALSARPLFSVKPAPIAPTVLLSYFEGGSPYSAKVTFGEVYSNYEISIDDVYLSTAAGLNGSLYVIAQTNADSSLQLFSPGGTDVDGVKFLSDMLAMWTINGSPSTNDYVCINLSLLGAGPFVGVSNIISTPVVDVFNAPIADVFNSSLTTGLYAGINTSPYSII